MSEWREYQLDDVAVINPSESLKKGELARKVPMEYLSPFTKKVSGFSIESYDGGMKFRNGDTIIARITPSLENGKTAFIDFLDNDEIAFGSTEFIVLREKEKLSDKHFLYYFAISPEFRDVAILSMTGSSGRQRVQTDVVREHTFLLPPLPEQKAIATVLSSLDDKIDLLHRQNKTLEAMAETLFRQWFIEEADESWEEGKLGDLLDLAYGKGLKKEDRTGKGYPVVGSSGIVDYHSEFLVKGPGIVIGRKGTLGQTIFMSNNFYPIDTTFYVVPQNERTNFIYEYFLLRSINFLEMNSDSAVPGLNKNIALSTELLIPAENAINEFNKYVEPFWEKRIENQKQIQTLEKLRDTLLPKLMSGEVRVKKH